MKVNCGRVYSAYILKPVSSMGGICKQKYKYQCPFSIDNSRSNMTKIFHRLL